jgi:phosphoglycolate phosphatase-like HAD superfamily hydrolase
MNPIVVFDFDGVICDSTEECLLTSWNAWERRHGRSGYRTSLEEFSKKERDTFRPLRPYVRGAGEYYVLRRCLEENLPISGQSDFENYCRNWKQHLPSFKQIFYEERERMRTENPQDWLDLHPVWPEAIEILARLNKEGRVYVATLKDGESVRLILEAHHISLPVKCLLDQSQITGKLEALDTIRNIEGCSKGDILFLDDNAAHLVEPFRAGYRCYLTTWGYTPADHRKIAETHGIPLLSLTELFEIVGENTCCISPNIKN